MKKPSLPITKKNCELTLFIYNIHSFFFQAVGESLFHVVIKAKFLFSVDKGLFPHKAYYIYLAQSPSIFPSQPLSPSFYLCFIFI